MSFQSINWTFLFCSEKIQDSTATTKPSRAYQFKDIFRRVSTSSKHSTDFQPSTMWWQITFSKNAQHRQNATYGISRKLISLVSFSANWPAAERHQQSTIQTAINTIESWYSKTGGLSYDEPKANTWHPLVLICYECGSHHQTYFC